MAPKTPTFLRVEACIITGSLSSGGTHMVHLEPCCWKWHSSSNHTSSFGCFASRLSFFILRLRYRIGIGNHRTGLALTKTHLMKQSLTLPYPKINMLRSQMMAEKLSIPKIL